MSLSDSEERKTRKPGRRRAVGKYNGHWSDSQKIEAVQTWLVLGNLKLVSGTLKIPYDTLKVWKGSEWWKELVTDLQTQHDLQLSDRLRKIVNKSYSVVEDRLDNGDFVYDQKTGSFLRKPVNMRDAHKVAMDLMDKQEHLTDRHMAEKSVSVDSIDKKLADLAASFAKMAGAVKEGKTIEVTDVVFGTMEEGKDAEEES